MKIYVYAICKNEAKFVSRWLNSMREADGIFVLDTGSTDETVNLLTSGGATVKVKKVKPWRFDVARNLSLELVPTDADLCVCTDLDEVFDAGWREQLERLQDVTRVRYKYVWSVLEGGREGVTFLADKIHARHGYKWTHPVHEVIVPENRDAEKTVIADKIRLVHYPDDKKSRAQYLPLLELSVMENPDDDRNVHYLGREYMFNGENAKAIETLKKHLKLPSANWKEERSASMRYIAVCYSRLSDPKNAEKWYLRSIAECPDVKEPYLAYARFLYSRENWHGVIWCLNNLLAINTEVYSYISDPDCRGALPYDMLSIAYYKTGLNDDAYLNALKALDFGENARIRSNLKYFH